MTGIEPLEAALEYAERGWPVFPAWDKRPLIRWRTHATTDSARIKAWWRRWPRAAIGLPTDREFVVLDVDTSRYEPSEPVGIPLAGGSRSRKDKSLQGWNGFDSLRGLIEEWPNTPTAVSPSGGVHFYFAAPAAPMRNTVGAYGRGIGLGLDWRGQGGYAIAPGSPGYHWLAGRGLEVPILAIPGALLPRERDYGPANPIPAYSCDRVTRYFAGAVLEATRRILTAGAGSQERTLNDEAFSLGSLVAAGAGPAAYARRELIIAARNLQSFYQRRPWRRGEAEEKAGRAFDAGLRRPRATCRGACR